MSTKIINNSIETTDYDVAGYLQYAGNKLSYATFQNESRKTKVKMVAAMHKSEAERQCQ